MSTYAFTINLASPEAAKRYRALHQVVPSEIDGPGGALESIGLISMEIFHAAPQTLFMLVRGKEGFDPNIGFPLANRLHPAVQAWDDLMHGELLVRVPENDTDLNWYAMDPVYRWTIDQVQQETEQQKEVLLDCTLRDGGFQTNWKFSDVLLSGLVPALASTELDMIEIGYLAPPGSAPEQALSKAARAIAAQHNGQEPAIAVMADLKSWRSHGTSVFEIMEGQISALPLAVDCVRIAMPAFSDDESIAFAKDLAERLKDSGRSVAINLMQVDRMIPTEAYDLACRLHSVPGDIVIYLADSFGAMGPSDVQQIVSLFSQVLPNPIGFHAHDNLGLAVANCSAAKRAGATWFDGTLAGIGRGAGNAPTEHLVLLQNQTAGIERLSAFIGNHILPLRESAAWGPNAVYAACAQGGVHPSYGQYLLSDPRLDEAERLSIVAELARDKAIRFDRALLDRKVKTPA